MKKYILGFVTILLCFLIWFVFIRMAIFETHGKKGFLYGIGISTFTDEQVKTVWFNQHELHLIGDLIKTPKGKSYLSDSEEKTHYIVDLFTIGNKSFDTLFVVFYKNGDVSIGLGDALDGRYNYQLKDKKQITALKKMFHEK